MNASHISLLASLLLSSSLQAQQTTGSRLGVEQGRITEAKTSVASVRLSMDDYARCVVQMSPDRVKRFLSMTPVGKTYAREARSLISDDCLSSGELRIPPLVARTALFDRYYRLQYKAPPSPAVAVAPAINYQLDMTTEQARRQAAGLEFADCVVRANPLASHDLLSSAVESGEEKRAFAAIAPLLGPCLNAGAQATISKSVVRGLIAEVLYRLTVATSPSDSVHRRPLGSHERVR